MSEAPCNSVACSFDCGGDTLIGVLEKPAQPHARGVLIVTGGPQYRVGSHRQFTLLARSLSAQGYAVLRFDYRGMGDSGGDSRDFEAIDADIRAAIDALFAQVDGLRDVVIWGLCDAASAAMIYAAADTRVTGLALANPWARTEAGLADAYLQNYYGKRLFSRDFWRKVFKGDWRVGESLRAFFGNLITASGKREVDAADTHEADFTQRMLSGLEAFEGEVFLLNSGEDLTATEFERLGASNRRWRRALAGRRVTRHSLPAANHTFSRAVWRDEVAQVTAAWLGKW